jgi:hypothetical protein
VRLGFAEGRACGGVERGAGEESAVGTGPVPRRRGEAPNTASGGRGSERERRRHRGRAREEQREKRGSRGRLV